jgi:hypothetical protein
MNDRVKPGTRVSIIEPIHCKYVVRAHALNTEMAGYQLARVEGEELKLLLMHEGRTWARGWSTKAANALRVACAL